MPIADIVNTWFLQRLANGPLARDTEAYNQAFAAKADLITRLEAVFAPAPSPEPEHAADAASEE